jgi:predicted histidine transporter YuiF (NhaC family)
VKILWIVSAGIVGGGLGWALWKQVKNQSTGGTPVVRQRLIAATIVAMPLLMPFYFDYDLLLLSVAVVLFAAEIVAQQGEMSEEDRWLVRAWVVLFVVMFFNASVSGIIRVHLAVIPLTVVALLHIRRACRINQVTAV